jgi:Domain of unknown function (DUF4132)
LGIFDKVSKMFGSNKQADTVLDNAALANTDASDNDTNAVHNDMSAIITRLIVEAPQQPSELSKSAIFKEILSLPDTQKVQLLLCIVPLLHHEKNATPKNHDKCALLENLLLPLLKSKITFTDLDIENLVVCFTNNANPAYMALYNWPINDLLEQLIKQTKDKPISAQLTATLNRIDVLCKNHTLGYRAKEKARIEKKLNALMSAEMDSNAPGKVIVKPQFFVEDDAFAGPANAQIAALPDNLLNVLYEILALAQQTSGSKPSAKFLRESKILLESLGYDNFSNLSSDWFKWIITSKDTLPPRQGLIGYFSLCKSNADAIKIIVWMAIHANPNVAQFAQLAERSYQTIPNTGLACASLGNACFYALSQSGMPGISQLSRLRLRIKQASAQKIIDNYLSETADANGMSMTELEDISVPDFGLQDEKCSWQFNDYSAYLSIVGVGKTEILWQKPDGSPQKTMPTFVKDDFAEELKTLKNTAKQIEQTLTAQRDRIDRLFRVNHSMTMAHFEACYLKHHLMCYLAKNIFWNFTDNAQTISAVYLNGVWTSNQNAPISISANARVSLWHPANATMADTNYWRDFFLDHLIQQPLKQAYRELYVLTEAEANTRTYSNRMAAHILKQHQFNSLAKGRGWRYSLLGAWDGGDIGIAECVLAEYDLIAEYWVQSVEADDAYNDIGIWNYVSTDQVRFLNAQSNEPVEFIDVPAIVFSEMMRDADLFVGVASVGNDPNWQDSGGLPTYGNYWQSYSFGDLSEVAKTRKDILMRLIPKLKIKDIVTIKDKFLVVKGQLRTYKIHIGSTNILMEPNDQYLCIVPNQHNSNATDKIYLPFEGDTGLSIVLSKAFLLAEDHKITDSQITSQIKYKDTQ